MWPLIGPGRPVAAFDTATYSGPNLAVTLDAVRHGHLAQWNPFLYGGVSHLGNIQAAPVYPPKWPFAWMDVQRAWCWLVALHVAWLGLGLFWLVRRRLHLAPPAGLVAVATVVGSGAVMVRMLFFEQILVLAWAPWLLGAIDAAIGRGPAAAPARGRWAVPGLAVVTAATLCAGHPQIVYVLLPLAALWTVGRLLDAQRGDGPTAATPPPEPDAATERAARPRWTAVRPVAVGLVRRARPVVGGVLAGALLAAPQLLPALDQARRSANTGGRSLATLAQPGFSVVLRRLPGTWLGDPFAAVHSATAGGYENLSFVGVIASAAAVVALSRAGRSPRRWSTLALGVVVVAAVVAAIGPRLVFYRVALDVVPGFDQARVPARWVLAAVVATGVLAAEGTDRLWRTTAGRFGDIEARLRRTVSAVLGLAIAVAAFGPFTQPPLTTRLVWLALAAVVAGAQYVPARHQAVAVVVVALLGTAELGLAARHSALRGSRPLDAQVDRLGTSVLSFLQAHAVGGDPAGGKVFALTPDRTDDLAYVIASLRPNANALYRLASADGYDGGIQVTRRWVAAFAPLAAAAFQPDAPARNQLQAPLDPAAFAELGVQWLVVDRSVDAPVDPAAAWGPPVLVDGTLAVHRNPAFRGTAWLEQGTVRTIERPRPERIELGVDATAAGALVVTEQWDPGWTATVDGAPVEVVPSGRLGLGLDIPSGTHRVVLSYRAAHLRLGLALAALGLLSVLAPTAGRRLRSRRTARSAAA